MINLREWALPVYTIMMQMAAGSMLTLGVFYTLNVYQHGKRVADLLSRNLVMIIFITVAAAMVGSHYHLSRPYFSIFAVMNFKSSWLSREVAFTIAFAVLVGVLWLLQRYQSGGVRLCLVVWWGAVAMGLLTVYCMSHVYMLPTQVAWNSLATPVMFFSTTVLLGNLAVASLLLMNLYLALLREETTLENHQPIIQRTLLVMTLFVLITACTELVTYTYQINQWVNGNASARASLDLLLGLYRVLFGVRLLLLGLGVGTFSGVVFWQRKTRQPLVRLLTPVYFAFLIVLVGEVLARFLFFAVHVRTGI